MTIDSNRDKMTISLCEMPLKTLWSNWIRHRSFMVEDCGSNPHREALSQINKMTKMTWTKSSKIKLSLLRSVN